MNAPTRGAWLRAGISRDGGPVVETEHVVWLQSGDYYADSRGFAGTTSYEDGQVRFHHDVGAPGDDVGVLRAEGEGLIETGTNTDGSTFLEVWTPLPGSDGQDGSWCAGEAPPARSRSVQAPPVQARSVRSQSVRSQSVRSQSVRVGRHIVHVDSTGAGAHYVLPGPSGQ
ncbi:hypothetical protein [Streptomyces sp. A5-4]|uniref:hypothetical protein n=1 Tax=Streptomyces sp. A5-4 TaxID=3384771 RepID=UPI003DA96C15